MKRGVGMTNKEIGDVFAEWNKGVLDSFLIEITRDIMYYNDEDGTPLLEKTASPMRVTGWPRSRALMAVHLPVPFWPAESRIFSRMGVPSSSL